MIAKALLHAAPSVTLYTDTSFVWKGTVTTGCTEAMVCDDTGWASHRVDAAGGTQLCALLCTQRRSRGALEPAAGHARLRQRRLRLAAHGHAHLCNVPLQRGGLDAENVKACLFVRQRHLHRAHMRSNAVLCETSMGFIIVRRAGLRAHLELSGEAAPDSVVEAVGAVGGGHDHHACAVRAREHTEHSDTRHT